MKREQKKTKKDLLMVDTFLRSAGYYAEMRCCSLVSLSNGPQWLIRPLHEETFLPGAPNPQKPLYPSTYLF